ncbi:hypothetical protein H6F98_12095 [Microcoleus sp. FACHB-SPT15]|nr:hypothetical protein [Microcoleus sp. FACHB-SPT15]
MKRSDRISESHIDILLDEGKGDRSFVKYRMIKRRRAYHAKRGESLDNSSGLTQLAQRDRQFVVQIYYSSRDAPKEH